MYTKKLFSFLIALLLCSEVALAKPSKKNTPINSNGYDEVVSLGGKCQVCIQTRDYGIRKTGYPFDWLITPINGLESFIINKGKYFLDHDKISYGDEYPGSPGHYQVFDTIYGFSSFHDFNAPGPRTNYIEVKAKYDRRTERLFSLLNSNKKVLLIRLSITKDEAIHLDQLIHNLYPNLNYTLVALNNTDDFKIDWGINRIRNFYISIDPWDWKGDTKRWGEILKNFPFKPSKKNDKTYEAW